MDVEIRVIGDDRDEVTKEVAALAASLGVAIGDVSFEPSLLEGAVAGVAVGAVLKAA